MRVGLRFTHLTQSGGNQFFRWDLQAVINQYTEKIKGLAELFYFLRTANMTQKRECAPVWAADIDIFSHRVYARQLKPETRFCSSFINCGLD